MMPRALRVAVGQQDLRIVDSDDSALWMATEVLLLRVEPASGEAKQMVSLDPPAEVLAIRNGVAVVERDGRWSGIDAQTGRTKWTSKAKGRSPLGSPGVIAPTGSAGRWFVDKREVLELDPQTGDFTPVMKLYTQPPDLSGFDATHVAQGTRKAGLRVRSGGKTAEHPLPEADNLLGPVFRRDELWVVSEGYDAGGPLTSLHRVDAPAQTVQLRGAREWTCATSELLVVLVRRPAGQFACAVDRRGRLGEIYLGEHSGWLSSRGPHACASGERGTVALAVPSASGPHWTAAGLPESPRAPFLAESTLVVPYHDEVFLLDVATLSKAGAGGVRLKVSGKAPLGLPSPYPPAKVTFSGAALFIAEHPDFGRLSFAAGASPPREGDEIELMEIDQRAGGVTSVLSWRVAGREGAAAPSQTLPAPDLKAPGRRFVRGRLREAWTKRAAAAGVDTPPALALLLELWDAGPVQRELLAATLSLRLDEATAFDDWFVEASQPRELRAFAPFASSDDGPIGLKAGSKAVFRLEGGDWVELASSVEELLEEEVRVLEAERPQQASHFRALLELT